jgi:K(+)-stimulated pyrophosphate-energized sodium pump
MMTTSSSAAWDSFRRVYWTIAATLGLLLLLFWLMGFGPGGRACKVTSVASAPVAAKAVAPSPAPSPAAVVPSVAPVTPSTATQAAASAAPPPAATLYFALDKTTLPQNAAGVLTPIVDYLKANESAKASISGFHDPSGSRARNEELALNRARAVRAALERAGIARERIVMQKPSVTTGSGPAAEARRVEVSVQRS